MFSIISSLNQDKIDSQRYVIKQQKIKALCSCYLMKLWPVLCERSDYTRPACLSAVVSASF